MRHLTFAYVCVQLKCGSYTHVTAYYEWRKSVAAIAPELDDWASFSHMYLRGGGDGCLFLVATRQDRELIGCVGVRSPCEEMREATEELNPTTLEVSVSKTIKK